MIPASDLPTILLPICCYYSVSRAEGGGKRSIAFAGPGSSSWTEEIASCHLIQMEMAPVIYWSGTPNSLGRYQVASSMSIALYSDSLSSD